MVKYMIGLSDCCLRANYRMIVDGLEQIIESMHHCQTKYIPLPTLANVQDSANFSEQDLKTKTNNRGIS